MFFGFLKRNIFRLFLGLMILNSMVSLANAQGTTVLPKTSNASIEDCNRVIAQDYSWLLLPPPQDEPREKIDARLTCAVLTGEIHFWMLPYFIRYLAEFLIGLAGILCMLFIVVGGYHYVFGGVTEEKDKGKRTLVYAIGGLALVLLSWTMVNVVLFLVTG